MSSDDANGDEDIRRRDSPPEDDSEEAVALPPEIEAQLEEERLAAERSYFNVSRTLSASLLFVLPLLAIYELGVLSDVNAAAVWMKTPVSWLRRHPVDILGANSTIVLNAVGLVLVIVAVVRLHQRRGLHTNTFLGMLVESGAYALLLGPVAMFPLIGRWQFVTFSPNFDKLWAKIVIAAGAGLYEELFFRFVLLGIIFFLAQKFGKLKRFTAGFVALVISAAVFSAAHFLSPSESAELGAFIYRLSAGVVLGVIYLTRGLGVAAWTHALYDVYVLCFTKVT